jgi:hypothetical protein
MNQEPVLKRQRRWSSRGRNLLLLLAAVFHAGAAGAAPPACALSWEGQVLIDGDALRNWTVENDAGSSGTLALVEGIAGGQAVQLAWDIGSGDWVQGKYTFPAPVDLSNADVFGMTLRGGGASELPDTVAIMFADVNDVFYGYDMSGASRGINQIDRPLRNLSFPRELLRFYFSFGASTTIDWSRINRFFFVVKRPAAGSGGGAGRLTIDHVQYDTAARWPRQTQFETVAAPPGTAPRAVEYLLSQQKPTGLLLSWKEEPSPKAWLYDQALALIVLTREGVWTEGAPTNEAARAAAKLVGFLVPAQKPDGHWGRAWDPVRGVELVDDGWVGDQAWWVMALSTYSRKSGDAPALDSARRAAAWLASRIDADGKATASTEGNVDVWWALVSTFRFSEAARLKAYLFAANTVWDPDLRYWWRGYRDPVIAMDAATWLSAFARHPYVGAPDRALAALSFVRRTLVTTDDGETACGFDGMGPVSIWNEGTAQYVAAGGQDAQDFLEMLTAQQKPDGSMPGSPDRWSSDSFGWLSDWSGVAPTAWLYFAVAGSPFPLDPPVKRGDANGDGGYDIADPIVILSYLFADGTIRSECPGTVADVNRDHAVDIADPIVLLSHLFAEGPPPDSVIEECE